MLTTHICLCVCFALQGYSSPPISRMRFATGGCDGDPRGAAQVASRIEPLRACKIGEDDLRDALISLSRNSLHRSYLQKSMAPYATTLNNCCWWWGHGTTGPAGSGSALNNARCQTCLTARAAQALQIIGAGTRGLRRAHAGQGAGSASAINGSIAPAL